MQAHRIFTIVIGLGAVGCGSSGTAGGGGTAGPGGVSPGGTGGASSGGSGGNPSGGSGGVPSGGQGGASGGSGGAASCSCATGEGCLRPTVTRSADTSNQPWLVWPSEADGKGTLIVSAVDAGTVIIRVPMPNADMTPAAASYEFDLGCVPAKTLTPSAFFDDNENAPADAWFSSDYRDSCMLDRQPTLAVQADIVNTFALVLNNSCD